MSEKAAFFRVEGPLSPRPTVAAAAYLAANSQEISGRLARLGNVALAAPFLFGGPLADPAMGARVTWMGLRGMSHDRLAVLGQEYAERFVIPSLRETGLRLLKEATKSGHRIVLLSDNLHEVMEPVRAHLGADSLVCNRLELAEGKATGRLDTPVFHGAEQAKWVQRYAAETNTDLATSLAYGAQDDDQLLLSAIGRPCVVHPNRGLRNVARTFDWPVVEG